MSTALVEYTPEQVDLITRTLCKGATPDELQLFLMQCRRTGLDPFSKQIHAVKRWDRKEGRDVMSIQVGIDGFRLLADRTERYVPGRETVYGYDEAGRLLSATAYVKKLVAGQWHEIAATAHFDEYVQTTKDGSPNHFWARMPHVMLGKVAEALALRKAFPHDLGGLYTPEEMGQADNPEAPRLEDKRTPAAANGHAAPGPDLDEFRARLVKFDQQRAREGLALLGETLAAVAAAAGAPADLQRWGPHDVGRALPVIERLRSRKVAAAKPAEPERISVAQVAELVALCEAASEDPEEVLQKLGLPGPLGSLPLEHFAQVKEALEAAAAPVA